MKSTTLVPLVREVAKLTSDRSSTPRQEGLAQAHALIRDVANQEGLSETWCDAVFIEFVPPVSKAA